MMKRKAIINVGLLWDVIAQRYNGSIRRAAADWQTGPDAINTVLSGHIPRGDAFARVLKGSKLSAKELIIGSSHMEKGGPRRSILPGRWLKDTDLAKDQN